MRDHMRTMQAWRKKSIDWRALRAWAALIDEFLWAQDLRLCSRMAYRRNIQPFLGWLTQQGIVEPSRVDLVAYKRTLEARGLAALTLSNYLGVIRRFFVWTEEQQRYPNIAKGLKGAKRGRGFRKDALTLPQIKAVLASIDRSTVRGQRDFALINLLVRVGLRTIELVRANIWDIQQTGGQTVLWVHGKGRDAKDEFVVLTPATLQPIRTYLAEREPLGTSAPLFASLSDLNPGQRLTTHSVSRLVKGYLRHIGLDSPRLTTHSLRHTAITLCLQGGGTLQEAQVLGRHASITTTLIYAHNLDRLARPPERRIDEVLANKPRRALG